MTFIFSLKHLLQFVHVFVKIHFLKYDIHFYYRGVFLDGLVSVLLLILVAIKTYKKEKKNI